MAEAVPSAGEGASSALAGSGSDPAALQPRRKSALVLPPAHLAALEWVLARLASAGGGGLYHATGGLAGALHGSSHPVHDLDLDVDNAALERLAAQVESAGPSPGGSEGGGTGPRARAHVWHPLGPYSDGEFRLELYACYEVFGVEVDLAGSTGCWLRRRRSDSTRSGRTRVQPEGAEEYEEAPGDVDVRSGEVEVFELPGLSVALRVQSLDDLLWYKVRARVPVGDC